MVELGALGVEGWKDGRGMGGDADRVVPISVVRGTALLSCKIH